MLENGDETFYCSLQNLTRCNESLLSFTFLFEIDYLDFGKKSNYLIFLV